MPVNVPTKKCEGPCGRSRSVMEFWRDAAQPDGYMRKCVECVQARRDEIAAARARGEDVPRVSVEERKRRSEQAIRLHEEGRLGGSEFGRQGGIASGQARRVPSISEGILEHFRQDSKFELVVRAFESNLRAQSHPARLAAAREIVRMDQASEEFKLKLLGQGKRPEDLTPEELQKILEEGLLKMLTRGGDLSALTLPDSAVREVA